MPLEDRVTTEQAWRNDQGESRLLASSYNLDEVLDDVTDVVLQGGYLYTFLIRNDADGLWIANAWRRESTLR